MRENIGGSVKDVVEEHESKSQGDRALGATMESVCIERVVEVQ